MTVAEQRAGSGPRSTHRRRRWRRRRRRRASRSRQDRERRLSEEHQTANARLDTLRTELSDPSQADSALAEQMAEWQIDLETREATLADGEARLAKAEGAVHAADTALSDADHALDHARRESQSHNDELHHAELRHTELGGASRGHSWAARDRMAPPAGRYARARPEPVELDR